MQRPGSSNQRIQINVSPNQTEATQRRVLLVSAWRTFSYQNLSQLFSEKLSFTFEPEKEQKCIWKNPVRVFPLCPDMFASQMVPPFTTGNQTVGLALGLHQGSHSFNFEFNYTFLHSNFKEMKPRLTRRGSWNLVKWISIWLAARVFDTLGLGPRVRVCVCVCAGERVSRPLNTEWHSPPHSSLIYSVNLVFSLPNKRYITSFKFYSPFYALLKSRLIWNYSMNWNLGLC